MAVPKRKTTPSKRGMRRAHDKLDAPAYIEDKDSPASCAVRTTLT